MNDVPAAGSTPSSRAIKVGIHILQTDGPPALGWREASAIALRAEELGFDSVSMGDHLVMQVGEDRKIGVWDC